MIQLKQLRYLLWSIFFSLLSLSLTACGGDDDEPDLPGETGKNEQGISYKTFKVGDVSFKMIHVDGGTFQMGPTTKDAISGYKIDDFCYPVHQVTLSSYYIAEFQVTRQLYNAVMYPDKDEDFSSDLLKPENGDYEDWENFIAKLNEVTGLKFRMPTEAEWEYAARGGKKSKGYIFPGSDLHDQVAYSYCNSGDNYLAEYDWNWWTMKGNNCKTHVVGTLLPNELGIYDMGGNLQEWCSDWFGPYSSEPQTNPQGPETGTTKCCRGGSYAHFSDESLCSHRRGSPLSECIYWGLRLAMSE